jgi:hypothetical protein
MDEAPDRRSDRGSENAEALVRFRSHRRKALAPKTPPEAMTKLLSSENLQLLHLIATKRHGVGAAIAGAWFA